MDQNIFISPEELITAQDQEINTYKAIIHKQRINRAEMVKLKNRLQCTITEMRSIHNAIADIINSTDPLNCVLWQEVESKD